MGRAPAPCRALGSCLFCLMGNPPLAYSGVKLHAVNSMLCFFHDIVVYDDILTVLLLILMTLLTQTYRQWSEVCYWQQKSLYHKFAAVVNLTIITFIVHVINPWTSITEPLKEGRWNPYLPQTTFLKVKLKRRGILCALLPVASLRWRFTYNSIFAIKVTYFC